jgi:hypothetical protein
MGAKFAFLKEQRKRRIYRGQVAPGILNLPLISAILASI